VFAIAGWAAGGIGLYFNYWLPEDPVSSNLFLLGFPLGFSIPAVSTFRRAWHRQAHGTSALTMDTMPGRLGQTLDGRVQTGVDPSAMKSDAFQVALTCYHRSKSGDNTSWRVLWVDVEIPVFEPEGSPATAPEKSSPPTGTESSLPESTDKPDRPSPEEPAPSREPAAPDSSSSQEPAPSGLDPDEAFSDHTDSDDTDRYGDETEERFSDDTFSGDTGDEDTVQCDDCYSTVDASASTRPAYIPDDFRTAERFDPCTFGVDRPVRGRAEPAFAFVDVEAITAFEVDVSHDKIRNSASGHVPGADRHRRQRILRHLEVRAELSGMELPP